MALLKWLGFKTVREAFTSYGSSQNSITRHNRVPAHWEPLSPIVHQDMLKGLRNILRI